MVRMFKSSRYFQIARYVVWRSLESAAKSLSAILTVVFSLFIQFLENSRERAIASVHGS